MGLRRGTSGMLRSPRTIVSISPCQIPFLHILLVGILFSFIRKSCGFFCGNPIILGLDIDIGNLEATGATSVVASILVVMLIMCLIWFCLEGLILPCRLLCWPQVEQEMLVSTDCIIAIHYDKYFTMWLRSSASLVDSWLMYWTSVPIVLLYHYWPGLHLLVVLRVLGRVSSLPARSFYILVVN